MDIVYLCDFNLNRSSGKDRATKQKLQSLSEIASSLKVYGLYKEGKLYKVFKGLILDINCAFYILRTHPDVLISRGNTGFISYLAAKKSGVLTVREIHALATEEVGFLSYKGLELILLRFLIKIFHNLDLMVDVRIFNHPFLLDFYNKKGWSDELDFYCYNGYADEVSNNISKSEARAKFSLNEEYTYLVFTGSVSAWHGVNYLVDLQKEFDKNGDKIKIIVGGGGLEDYDPDNVCINITPLNDIGCNDLIIAADACLLPVNNNRVSPGSPLKLYDYIKNNRPIIAEDITGYSDEVIKYHLGIAVSYKNSQQVRDKIIKYLEGINNDSFTGVEINVSWKDRMNFWIDKLQNAL